jgi:hypothetical protein
VRNWIKDILLIAGRFNGYFQPETIRQLVAQHMDGADHSMKLGALITLELWHRQFID